VHHFLLQNAIAGFAEKQQKIRESIMSGNNGNADVVAANALSKFQAKKRVKKPFKAPKAAGRWDWG
jgi:flagellar basal body rod protein FlgC